MAWYNMTTDYHLSVSVFLPTLPPCPSGGVETGGRIQEFCCAEEAISILLSFSDWYCFLTPCTAMHLQDPPCRSLQPPSSSSINEPVSGIRRRASRRRAGDLGWRSDREAKCSAATSWGATLSEIPRAEKSKRSYCQSWKKKHSNQLGRLVEH